MEEVPTFVLAVAIAVAVIIVLAPLFYVMSRPVVASAPYLAVKPASAGNATSLSGAANGMLVNVSIADFYAEPKGAFWYVNGRFAGYGNWTLRPLRRERDGGGRLLLRHKGVSGQVVCTRPFTVAPAVKTSFADILAKGKARRRIALFQGNIKMEVTTSIDPESIYAMCNAMSKAYRATSNLPPYI
jgi:hypothetical protein